MECAQLVKNESNCTCTYMSCEKRGRCCECIQSHLAQSQLPGCCFPQEVEKTYDRSFRRFAQIHCGH
ncbi:MAG: DUF6485 family protein [Armatimonadota bacterium]|jgi:hypothetical protein